MRILRVDSNHEAFCAFRDVDCEFARSGEEALLTVRVRAFDAVVAALPLPDMETDEFLEALLRTRALPVILESPRPTWEEAVHFTKLGAHAYVPADMSSPDWGALLLSLPGRQLAASEPWREHLVGRSRAMEQIADVVRLVAPRRTTVLITGETGTGKEMVARAIHAAGPRADGPMVSVNCGALPENLLEAELFGHVKGAFTGAHANRVGRFEMAHRGTLLLDEIGDMPLELQVKLLRVLQDRVLERLGSSERVPVDVRLIAATNADLKARIREGKFREDLYYRLNVVPLRLPPLRERAGDIAALVEHFLDKICAVEDLPAKRVALETMDRLAAYDWPGNVRQLENAVEMAIALSGDRRLLYPSDFPLPALERRTAMTATESHSVLLPDEGIDFEKLVGGLELDLIEQALRRARGNKKRAAELLRLKRTTFGAKLRTLNSAVATASA